MLVDLNLLGKPVLILGEGSELEARIRQFLDAGAKVIAASSGFSGNLKRLTSSERLVLVACNYSDSWQELAEQYDPYAVIIATTNRHLASQIAEQIRRRGQALIYAVDAPDLNDFNMPAIAKLGDIRVGVSTGGISPAMARLLRKRIEQIITSEDIREVQLQALMREKIRKRIPSSELRKACVYKIINNKRIREVLRANNFEEAERLASRQVELIARRN